MDESVSFTLRASALCGGGPTADVLEKFLGGTGSSDEEINWNPPLCIHFTVRSSWRRISRLLAEFRPRDHRYAYGRQQARNAILIRFSMFQNLRRIAEHRE